jgi:hypothetical protein
MPQTKLGHYAFSKARRVTQEASRVQMTVWNRKFVSIYICINVHNFPQNNYCPFILGWIAFKSNKAKTFVTPSVRCINPFASRKTLRRVPMDINPVKSRGEVLRQLGTFNRRWSEPILYANEEQRPLNTSANALKQTRIVPMNTTTNVAHHSQSKV